MKAKVLKSEELFDKIRELCIIRFFNAARQNEAAVFEDIINKCKQLLKEAGKHPSSLFRAEEKGTEAQYFNKNEDTQMHGCLDDGELDTAGGGKQKLSEIIKQAYFDADGSNADEAVKNRAKLLEWEVGRNPYKALQDFSNGSYVFCADNADSVEDILQKVAEILETEPKVLGVKQQVEVLFSGYLKRG